MADSALGSALFIPESALKKIKEADDKLQKLQDTAKNTASSVTQSFKDMSVGTKPFLNSLDQVIAKLATINASASNASSGISNVGASAGNMNNNITSAAQNIQNMVAQLSKMNGSGTSGIMQAALAFQRLQESAKGASGMNIAELKQEIGSIESMLRDTTQNLTKADQDALIKRKKSLQDELRYQQQMYNERAVAFQKALDKMVSAEQSYNNKQRKAYADRAKDYQTRNNKANTTYQGALDFSATANTLNRQVRAIEYLKEARMKLSQTDADYKRKLDILNAAIEQHNKNLKEAGVNSRALTEQTSYMAGYMSRWAQRMAFAFSVGSVKNFVEQIASVRGQFELSERSLEAILQNKPKADEIFNKTVELAVKSPFRIKDLVDYTRQLSAYRIESDKLYDTTKRLADVSAGLGVDNPKNAATIANGTLGIFHGMKSYFCQDKYGQIAPVYSISAGLDYPGIGPEHANLSDTGRAKYVPVTDEEAVNAFEYLSRTEGIIPAIESAHAVAHCIKLAPTMSKDSIIVVNLSGRGDKDVAAIARYRGENIYE